MTKLYMIYYGDVPAFKVCYGETCKRGYIRESAAKARMTRVAHSPYCHLHDGTKIIPEKFHIVTFVPEEANDD